MTLAIEYETISRAISHDGSAGGCRKMRREDKPPTVCMFLEEFHTRLSRLIGIRAKARAPRGIAHLQRMMHQVGTQDRFLAPAGKSHEREARRVARRRLQCDVARKHMLVADEIGLAGLEDRQNAIRDVVAGARERRSTGRAPIVPFPLRNEVARIGKGGYP